MLKNKSFSDFFKINLMIEIKFFQKNLANIAAV